MTRHELALAQFLRDTYERAQELADRHDPQRNSQHKAVIAALERIYNAAGEGFRALTERSPSEVKFFELSTTTPSPWAKAYHVRKDYAL